MLFVLYQIFLRLQLIFCDLISHHQPVKLRDHHYNVHSNSVFLIIFWSFNPSAIQSVMKHSISLPIAISKQAVLVEKLDKRTNCERVVMKVTFLDLPLGALLNKFFSNSISIANKGLFAPMLSKICPVSPHNDKTFRALWLHATRRLVLLSKY